MLPLAQLFTHPLPSSNFPGQPQTPLTQKVMATQRSCKKLVPTNNLVPVRLDVFVIMVINSMKASIFTPLDGTVKEEQKTQFFLQWKELYAM